MYELCFIGLKKGIFDTDTTHEAFDDAVSNQCHSLLSEAENSHCAFSKPAKLKLVMSEMGLERWIAYGCQVVILVKGDHNYFYCLSSSV